MLVPMVVGRNCVGLAVGSCSSKGSGLFDECCNRDVGDFGVLEVAAGSVFIGIRDGLAFAVFCLFLSDLADLLFLAFFNTVLAEFFHFSACFSV